MSRNLIDNYHKADRRETSSIIEYAFITEKGAAKRLCKVYPQLAGGKLTGNAIRVPTPNVFYGDFNT